MPQKFPDGNFQQKQFWLENQFQLPMNTCSISELVYRTVCKTSWLVLLHQIFNTAGRAPPS